MWLDPLSTVRSLKPFSANSPDQSSHYSCLSNMGAEQTELNLVWSCAVRRWAGRLLAPAILAQDSGTRI